MQGSCQVEKSRFSSELLMNPGQSGDFAYVNPSGAEGDKGPNTALLTDNQDLRIIDRDVSEVPEGLFIDLASGTNL